MLKFARILADVTVRSIPFHVVFRHFCQVAQDDLVLVSGCDRMIFMVGSRICCFCTFMVAETLSQDPSIKSGRWRNVTVAKMQTHAHITRNCTQVHIRPCVQTRTNTRATSFGRRLRALPVLKLVLFAKRSLLPSDPLQSPPRTGRVHLLSHCSSQLDIKLHSVPRNVRRKNPEEMIGRTMTFPQIPSRVIRW